MNIKYVPGQPASFPKAPNVMAGAVKPPIQKPKQAPKPPVMAGAVKPPIQKPKQIGSGKKYAIVALAVTALTGLAVLIKKTVNKQKQQ